MLPFSPQLANLAAFRNSFAPPVSGGPMRPVVPPDLPAPIGQPPMPYGGEPHVPVPVAHPPMSFAPTGAPPAANPYPWGMPARGVPGQPMPGLLNLMALRQMLGY